LAGAAEPPNVCAEEGSVGDVSSAASCVSAVVDIPQTTLAAKVRPLVNLKKGFAIAPVLPFPVVLRLRTRREFLRPVARRADEELDHRISRDELGGLPALGAG
jgi:hypothetical protein